MREIRTSGLMSGEGKRVAHATPRLSSTLLCSPCFSVLKALLACLIAERKDPERLTARLNS